MANMFCDGTGDSMAANDNYHDTVYRMYESVDILYKKRQWFNANYLSGYILECYCKLILLISANEGHIFSNNRQNVMDFGHKVSDLKTELNLITFEGCAVSSYCLDVQSVCTNILNHWNPNKRYEADSSIWNTETLASDIHAEIELLMDMVIKMEIDGALV